MYTRTKCAGILLKIYPQTIHCEQKKWSRHKWWRAGPDVSEEEKEETEILGSSISNEKAVKKGEFHGEG